MIKLEFNIDSINTILQSLGNMPYVKVAEVINDIRRQAEPQADVSNNQQKDTEEKTRENDKGSGEAVRYIEESAKPE